MQIKSPNHLLSIQLPIWISLGIILGWSQLTLALPQITELKEIKIAQDSTAEPSQKSDSQEVFFEMKGHKINQCRQTGNTTTRECREIGSGYKMGLRIGNELYSRGKVENAGEIFYELVKQYPKESEARYKLATIYYRLGQADEAIKQYQETIQLNPEHAKARNDLAVVMANQGNLGDAITLWREAIKINSDYAEALSNLGHGLLQQEEQQDPSKHDHTIRDEAIADLKKAYDIFTKQGRKQPANTVAEYLQQLGVQ